MLRRAEDRHPGHRRGDAGTLEDVRSAAERGQVNTELIAPAVGGIEASDGNQIPADQKVDGGPSVLYDAVIVLASKHGATELASMPAARDFVTDAYAHCKFIGYAATPPRCSRRPDWARRWTTASSAWTSTKRQTSSRVAPSCGTGSG
jgi:C-terminal domain found in long catalases